MFRRLLQPVRCLTILLSIFVYLAHMSLMWVLIRDRWSRIAWANRNLKYWARWGCWVLKVRPNPIGTFDRVRDVRGALFVGNHLSYMDVLVFASNIDCGFVTSMEIKETPVLGQVCTMAGCSFVERRNKMNIHNEVREISETLKAGLNVAIFPESTSTNGEQILRFRRPLYTAAIDAGRPVIPFCINYRLVGGRPIDSVSRDTVMWYGDMEFVSHLWALSGNGGTVVDLIFLEPIPTSPADESAALAEASQRAVESVFKPVPKA